MVKVHLKLTTPPHACSNRGIKYTSSPRHIDHDVALSRPDDKVGSVSHGRAGGRRELVHPRQAFFVDGDGKARQGVNHLFMKVSNNQHHRKKKKKRRYVHRTKNNKIVTQNTITKNTVKNTVTQNKLQL